MPKFFSVISSKGLSYKTFWLILNTFCCIFPYFLTAFTPIFAKTMPKIVLQQKTWKMNEIKTGIKNSVLHMLGATTLSLTTLNVTEKTRQSA